MKSSRKCILNAAHHNGRNLIIVVAMNLCLLLLTTGCRTKMAVKFGNATSSKVWVSSLQSGKEIEIKTNRFKKLAHGSGDIIVRTETERHLTFKDISAFHVEQSYTTARGSIFGVSSVHLTVLLDTNLQLYAVIPGKTGVDENIQQPKGYPKIGVEVSN